MTIEQLRERIQKEHKIKKSWRKVGAVFGITGAMAFRIAKRGYEPKSSKIRYKLGLPALVEVVPCYKCGDVHTTKRCTSNGNKPRNRRAISGTDEVSAADTIINCFGKAYAVDLMLELERRLIDE